MGDPRDMAGALRKMLRRVDPEGKRDKPRVVEAWRRAAGAEIVRHSLGYDVRAGELLVFVDSPVWATELAALSEELRVRVNEDIGEEAVRSIRFAVSKQVSKRAEAERRRLAEEEPARSATRRVLSEEERTDIRARAEAVSSEDLREAVIRAMEADARGRGAGEPGDDGPAG